ncbi:MAG: hypothetical protein M1276_04890 [Deltaproteobacteria bacterium]|jgi:hypothetical protein|nr:hypothetical protein [Deltaproteobacteria bacterium]
MNELNSRFYNNQEIVLETPKKNFKGYIKKIEDGFLYIILYSSFTGGQTFEFNGEDYDIGADVSLIENSGDITIISSGFSKTFLYKPLLENIVKNKGNISLKVKIADAPAEEREGREFLRINAVIQFIYEEISIEEFLETKDGYIARPSLTTSVYGMYGIAAPKIYQSAAETDSDVPVNPKIEKLLIAINSKLDVILSLINPEASIFAGIKEKRVSISGSGIMWSGDDKGLNLGSIIKITMLFPTVPQFLIKALAQVVKISKEPAETDVNVPLSIASVACKFTAINEYDRDEIIKFTLEQQRRQIKKAR